MTEVFNFSPMEDIDLSVKRRVIIWLKKPPSSTERPVMGLSGLLRISGVRQLQRHEHRLVKDFKSWMVSTTGQPNDALDEILKQDRIKQKTFHDINECLEYISSHERKCVILVLSSYHVRNKEIMARLKRYKQIAVIYRYTTEKYYQKLRDRWFNEVQFIARDILPKNFTRTQINNLGNAQQLLLMQVLLSQIVVHLSKDPKAYEDFIEFWRSSCGGGVKFEETLVVFNRTYKSEDAIKWYTNPKSSIYRMISEMSASSNIEDLQNIRFYLGDLYQQLKALHEEQLEEGYFHDKITVYRGVRISKDEFERISTIGDLLITRNFLSTTYDIEVAKMFSSCNPPAEGQISAIISMTIKYPEMQTRPMAFIGGHSHVPDENEVLLSLGMVFRIHSTKEVIEDNKKDYYTEIIMVRGEKEMEIEKDLSQISSILQTGTSLPLDISTFLVATPNGQRLGESIASISHILNQPSVQAVQQTQQVLNMNVSFSQVSSLITR